MKRYWDLSEKERSELDMDQIEALCRVELMEKGLFHPEEPVLVEVPVKPEPDLVVYACEGRYSSPNLCYETAEAAELAFAGARKINREYIGGDVVHVLGGTDFTIERLPLYSPEKLRQCRAALEAATKANTANEKARKDYEDASKKVSDALGKIISDRSECCAKAIRLQGIIRTYEQYTATADGDALIARKFLAKAYAPDDIAAAFEWYPQPEEVEAAAV